MKVLFAVACLLVSSYAWADDYTMSVNDQDLGVIGKALGSLPYNEVKSVIDKLNNQIGEQQLAKKKAAEQKDKTNEGQH